MLVYINYQQNSSIILYFLKNRCNCSSTKPAPEKPNSEAHQKKIQHQKTDKHTNHTQRLINYILIQTTTTSKSISTKIVS
jgi:hypothetical protein